MRGQMFLSNYKRYFYYEILRYEIFRKNRKKCSALQKIPKNERNLQHAANFREKFRILAAQCIFLLANIRLEI